MALFSTSANVDVSSVERPSIFILLASDSLRSSFPPAFQHSIRFLNDKYPEKLKWLNRFSDELFLVLDWAWQTHSLGFSRALFTEYFYGLERQGSLFKLKIIAVLLPYLKAKLQNFYEKLILYGEEDGLGSNSSLRNAVYYCVPILDALHKMADLILTIFYASGISRYHNVYNWLASSPLIYSGPERENLLTEKLLRLPLILRLVHHTASIGLEFGAFFLQFLEWWYAQRSPQNQDPMALPTPDPPAKSQQYKDKCPLCRGDFKTETVLPTSGFVFCYRCIVEHLQTESSCPVTGTPASLTQLVRLFPPA